MGKRRRGNSHQREIAERKSGSRPSDTGSRPVVNTEPKSKFVFRMPFSAATDTNVCLIVTLGLGAIQAMGVNVSTWIAVVCWLGVLVCLLDLIWREVRRHVLVKIAATVLSLIAVSSFVYRSWAGPLVPLGNVEVRFGDQRQFLATRLPHTETLKDGLESLTSDFMNGVPLNTLHLAPNSGKASVWVVVRNASKIPIHNANITIESTTPITSKSEGSFKFSDKEIHFEERTLHPFYKMGKEYWYQIEFEDESSVSWEDLSVFVESDNSETYIGYGRFSFVRGSS